MVVGPESPCYVPKRLDALRFRQAAIRVTETDVSRIIGPLHLSVVPLRVRNFLEVHIAYGAKLELEHPLQVRLRNLCYITQAL